MKVSRRGLLPMLLAPIVAAKAKLIPSLSGSEEASKPVTSELQLQRAKQLSSPQSTFAGIFTKPEASSLFSLGDVVGVSLAVDGGTRVVKGNLVSVERCLFTAYARFVEVTTYKDTFRRYEVTGIEGELVTIRQTCRTQELRRVTDPYGGYTAIHRVTQVWHFISKLEASDIRTPTATDEAVSVTAIDLSTWEPAWGSERLDNFQLKLMEEGGPFQKGEEITGVFNVPLVSKRPIDLAQIDRIRKGLL